MLCSVDIPGRLALFWNGGGVELGEKGGGEKEGRGVEGENTAFGM